MWYNASMSMQPIQVSIDEELLELIDEEPEVKERGRSAFIRSAIRLYLKAKERRAIDDQIRRAYEGCADEMLEEVAGLVNAQSWPEE
jgi:metal-responsive CopG/Arc/MetJ family transcriptional regulator